MSDPIITALNQALDGSAKLASSPFASTVLDRMLGFKLSEWSARGTLVKKNILDGYEEAKQKGQGIQYVSMYRSNTNLINTCIKAVKYITEEARKEMKANNDFFWGLLEHSKLISDDNVQELIAKILAGEYNTPGSYAMSTLQTVKLLGREEMEVFEFLGAFYLPDHGFFREFFQMNEAAISARKEAGIDYDKFLEMQNLGLIQSGSFTMRINISKDDMFKIRYQNELIVIRVLADKKNWNFPECFQLTTAGRQILKNLSVKKSGIFQDWLKVYLKSHQLEVVHSVPEELVEV